MLEKMHAFITLSECKSFTETSKRLFCSQPTITNQINQLEKHFQQKLVKRSSRTIELTSNGEIFLAYAKKMMGLYEELKDKMYTNTCDNNLPIYISHYIAGSYFHSLFPINNDMYHQCPLAINSFCYSDLKQSLIDKQAKFAIMPIYEQDELILKSFEIEVLFEEELILILSPHHPFSKRKLLYIRDLQNETILLPNSHFMQQEIRQSLQKKEVSPRFISMTNFDIIKQAVSQNMGISFLPTKAVESLLQTGELISKPVSGLKIMRKNGIVTQPNVQLDEQEQKIYEHIKQQLMN
ncbi:MAG: LysR family transcriptional regulator [Bacillus sp. (in: firmicutes)]